MPVFESIRQSLRDALRSATRPEERGEVVAEMKATLVRVRLGVDDLRAGVAATHARLAAEQRELETVRRRRALAAGIHDTETMAIAEKYERQHAGRVAVIERKLAAQAAELALAEAEASEMLAEFKAAAAGAGDGGGPGASPGASPGGPPGARTESAAAGTVSGAPADPLDDTLRESLDALGRERARAARAAAADEQLAALKRRMGR